MSRKIAVGAVVLFTGGCGILGSSDSGSTISGIYELTAVNSQALPCCGETDSTGQRVTIESGRLILGVAGPERFVATPAGYMPSMCVHEVPNGTHIDINGWVTLPDSTRYRIPSCTELHHGRYTFIISRRIQAAGGSSYVKADTLVGSYAWSSATNETPGMVSLLDAGMMGSIARKTSGRELTVQRSHFGMPTSDPVYTFRYTPFPG